MLLAVQTAWMCFLGDYRREALKIRTFGVWFPVNEGTNSPRRLCKVMAV
jgi:hypothetical protein